MRFHGRRLHGQTGLGTTKVFEMKWKMLQNLVRSRKSKKLFLGKREKSCMSISPALVTAASDVLTVASLLKEESR